MTLERNKQGGIYMKYLYCYDNGVEVVHNELVTRKTILKEGQDAFCCRISALTDDEFDLRKNYDIFVYGTYLTTVSLRR